MLQLHIQDKPLEAYSTVVRFLLQYNLACVVPFFSLRRYPPRRQKLSLQKKKFRCSAACERSLKEQPPLQYKKCREYTFQGS
jgi:hypothetical protein